MLRRVATARAAPVKLADGTVAKFIGVQVDVTRTTEGSCSAFADGALLRSSNPGQNANLARAGLRNRLWGSSAREVRLADKHQQRGARWRSVAGAHACMMRGNLPAG